MTEPAHLQLVAGLRVVSIVTGWPEDLVGVIANQEAALDRCRQEYELAVQWERLAVCLADQAGLPTRGIRGSGDAVMSMPHEALRAKPTRRDVSNHLTELFEDDEGWWHAACVECSWVAEGFPSADDASDAAGDHRVEMATQAERDRCVDIVSDTPFEATDPAPLNGFRNRMIVAIKKADL